jgi:phytoene desaturase
MAKKNKQVSVIGSGFSGLSAASMLAKGGANVDLFEKNDQIGGRARQFQTNGFTFDMGPSWYWMPDVIEKYFNKFNYTSSDFYDLKKLDPGFQIIFEDNQEVKIPANWEEMERLFDSIEPGSAVKLNKFITEAEFKYKVGVNDLVYQPGSSLTELMRPDLLSSLFKLQVFSSFSGHVRKFFKDPKLIALMEFPVLFLGAKPEKTPALYSLMNYSGLKTGTFYPMGGFGKVIDAMKQIAEEQGVNFHTSSNITKINVNNKTAHSISIKDQQFDFDAIVGAADYNHIEQHLLDEVHRGYDSKYWEARTFAPSCLLFYLGVKEKLNNLEHHNLFFDEDLAEHAVEIYDTKVWPKKPLFYVSCPSVTDPSVAPEGKENVFVLMPIAPGLKDSEEVREKYFEILLKRLSKQVGKDVNSLIEFKRSYCIKDFEQDYNAYKGNAYGLANTLMQTANLKPKLKSKKVNNLFFAGQLTVPGPGVPPSLISGQVAANEAMNYLNRK